VRSGVGAWRIGGVYACGAGLGRITKCCLRV